MPTESICFDSGGNNTFTFSIGMLTEGGGGEASQTAGQDRRSVGWPRGKNLRVGAKISWFE